MRPPTDQPERAQAERLLWHLRQGKAPRKDIEDSILSLVRDLERKLAIAEARVPVWKAEEEAW